MDKNPRFRVITILKKKCTQTYTDYLRVKISIFKKFKGRSSTRKNKVHPEDVEAASTEKANTETTSSGKTSRTSSIASL